MVLRGFDESTMRKVFEYFLHDSMRNSSGNARAFKTRNVGHSGKGNNQNLTEREIAESENEFKNSMALLYLKTFYGKRPEDFTTEEYKKECEKLRQTVNSSPNSSALKSKIEECIRRGRVDYCNGELPQGLFYEHLSDIGLSTDESDYGFFVERKTVTQARIYINPSQRDYRHLMEYLFEHLSRQELGLGVKTRLEHIGGIPLDNLILYTNAQDLPQIIEILNNYGREFPDKVADFGDTIECLGRSEQDWFGFGYEPQRTAESPKGESTFNYVVEHIFNSYIFPITILDDFDKITEGIGENKLTEIFVYACKDKKLAKEIALSLRDPNIRRQFLKNFYDLTFVREMSSAYSRDNAKLSETSRGGYSPDQLRFSREVDSKGNIIGGQVSDYMLIENEEIVIPLRNGRSVSLSRQNIINIFKSAIFRDAMEEYYDSPEKIEEKTGQMLKLWKNAGDNMAYSNSRYPFLSEDMARAIQKHEMGKSTLSKSETKSSKGQESKISMESKSTNVSVNTKNRAKFIAENVDDTFIIVLNEYLSKCDANPVEATETLFSKLSQLKAEYTKVAQAENLTDTPKYEYMMSMFRVFESFPRFTDDPTKGSGINFVNKRKHYLSLMPMIKGRATTFEGALTNFDQIEDKELANNEHISAREGEVENRRNLVENIVDIIMEMFEEFNNNFLSGPAKSTEVLLTKLSQLKREYMVASALVSGTRTTKKYGLIMKAFERFEANQLYKGESAGKQQYYESVAWKVKQDVQIVGQKIENLDVMD